MPSPAVTVVVPARDAAATLAGALAGIAAQDVPGGHEVIVVDDGSTDATAAIAAAAPGSPLLLTQGQLGPAVARNHGVRAATAPLVAFCDADCVPQPGWLAAGVRALESGAELVQGRVVPDPKVPIGRFDRSLWVEREHGLYEAASLFVTRSAFERVGGFEEWLVPRYGKALGEDTWFGWRVRRSGGPTAFCAEALVHHAVFPRGPRGHVAERRRLEHFPALIARVPELRGTLCWRWPFLSRRTAAFDAATLGVGAALLRRSPVPLVAAAPYALLGWRLAGARGPRSARVAGVELVADAVGLAALAVGSVSARTALL